MSTRHLALVAPLLVALTTPALAGTFAQPPPSPHSRIGGVTPITAAEPAPRLYTEVHARLAAERRASLARFRAYYRGGVYPANVFHAGELNVWRDQAAHYCAAATIIRASGAEELVEAIAETNNFIKLGDVTSGPVLDWILTSGLTQSEIALIQRPFRAVAPRPEAQPTRIVAIDPDLRATETRRLAALYRQIDAQLVASTDASLREATERLLADRAQTTAFLAGN